MSRNCGSKNAFLEKIVEEKTLNSPIRQNMSRIDCSPVTQIAQELSKSSLSGTSKNEFNVNGHGNQENHQLLFKNVFKIKSTPEGTGKSRLRGRRLLGMASRRLTSPGTRSPLQIIDKENDSAPCSPLNSMASPQKMTPAKQKSRLPLEDCDPNSQDSGYGASYQDDLKCPENFRFAEPLGVAPKRMSLDSPIHSSPRSKRAPTKFLIKKLSSGYESTDDDFNDLIDMDNLLEPTILPNDLNKLLSGEIIPLDQSAEKPMETDASTTPKFSRTSGIKPSAIRRSMSIGNDRLTSRTPPLSRVRSCLFRSPNATSSTSRLDYDENRKKTFSPQKSFKRPEPPTDASPILVKRSKTATIDSMSPDSPTASPPPSKYNRHMFQRSHSETDAHAHIKSAIHRSTTDSDLTGDFSKTCILPLATGVHADLKSISTETLTGLIRGEFTDCVGSFKIVDCRYPYEYEAGHIEGALNLYTKELIEEYLMNPLKQTPQIQADNNKRNILVFHCEFSWERGPNLSRYLRNIDRKLNKEHYPALHYPEIYLLHGGYKEFYRQQRDLCSPQGYRPMDHPDNEADLRKFRSKSKSWQGEKGRSGLSARGTLKRLGF